MAATRPTAIHLERDGLAAARRRASRRPGVTIAEVICFSGVFGSPDSERSRLFDHIGVSADLTHHKNW